MTSAISSEELRSHAREDREAASTTLELDESLDRDAIEKLDRFLRGAASRTERFVVDFSHVRDFDWFALASLVDALHGQPRSRVTLKGLCRQQARFLAYLGLETDESPGGMLH